jgi:hypothetical protein
LFHFGQSLLYIIRTHNGSFGSLAFLGFFDSLRW